MNSPGTRILEMVVTRIKPSKPSNKINPSRSCVELNLCPRLGAEHLNVSFHRRDSFFFFFLISQLLSNPHLNILSN